MDVVICGAEAGHRYFVAVRSATPHCAVYDVQPVLKRSNPGCYEVRQSAPDTRIKSTSLTPFLPVEDSVVNGAYKHYVLEIGSDRSNSNLLIEVSSLNLVAAQFSCS